MSAHWNRFLQAASKCSALFFLTTVATANPVTGTLQLTGTITIGSTTFNFCNAGSACPPAPGNWNIPGIGTGDLANPYANDPNGGTITNLTSVNAPVGTLLPANGLLFLTFIPSVALAAPDIQFYLTKLLAGVGGTASCAAAPAAGQTCTPSGSALTFLNVAGGTSTATISIQGKSRRISTNEFDTLDVVVSTQFPFSFQTVLAVLGGGGSVFSSYVSTYTASNGSAVAPVLQGAGSRKTHGAAGTFNLPM